MKTDEELRYLYTGINVSELIEHLRTFPPEAKVYYRDGNFGGPKEEFYRSHVDLDRGCVLIDSPYWEAVD